MQKLSINPKIEKHLWQLSESEFNQLKESIQKEGIREKIIVWRQDDDLIIVDGHNRYKIAEEFNIPFEIAIKEFTDINEVLEFVDKNQLGRRNLTDEQRQIIVGRIYEREKNNWGGKRISQEDNLSSCSNNTVADDINGNEDKADTNNNDSVDDDDFTVNSVQTEQEQEIKPKIQEEKFTSCKTKKEKGSNNATAKAVAKKTGVNEKTVRNSAKFNNAYEKIREIDSDVADKIASGEIKDAITRLPQIADDDNLLKKVVEHIKNGEVKKVKDAVKKIKKDEMLEYSKSINDNDITNDFRLIVKDIKELSSELEADSVDLIITDPPYPKEYLYLYEELAKLAKYVLKDGGSMFVMCGQSYIPEIIEKIKPYMDYFWLFAYTTPGGQSAQIWNRKVNTFWKPILQFVKGKYNGEWVGDVIKSDVNDNDKEFHDWGQSESGMSDLIKRVSKQGDLILDPFLGGGTTGVVSIAMNRRFIGADISQEAINIAKARLYKKNGDNKIA
jgi:site-specific DNA-methyltransferase (adenine-specific)